MLTDISRAPFTIKTEYHEAKNPPLDNSFWSWQLIGNDGLCFESSSVSVSQAMEMPAFGCR
jgi:hypothetical protein